MSSATPGALGTMLLKRNLTREEAAEKAHIDRKTITKIDQGRPVKVETLIKLADSLRVPLTYLTIPTEDEGHSRNAEVGSPAGNLLLKKLTAGDVPELLPLVERFDWKIELPSVEPKAHAILEKFEQIIESFHAWLNSRERHFERTPLRSQLIRLQNVQELGAVLEELKAERIAILAGTYISWRRSRGKVVDKLFGETYEDAEQYTSTKVAVLYVEPTALDSKRVSVKTGPQPPRYSHENLDVLIDGVRFDTQAEVEARGGRGDGCPYYKFRNKISARNA